MLDKTFTPGDIEPSQYKREEEASAFTLGQKPDGTPFTIVIPPPNVTGSLHMGHALNNTLQDILMRWRRMQGRDALWQPGTDHAGIATQMVVERQLDAEGTSRVEMGREKFLERVWEWKEQSDGTITNQLRRLGCSCDWDRERFTLDEDLSAAVRKVFVAMHREGLIYKDTRLVNWDPKLGTAISDLEVQPTDIDGNLWYFRYPLEDDPNRHIIVATTRPETMLGDTGVAVHPDDERYKDLVGKHCILPLVGRRIPIVADEYADPEQGSGAVKITPAHDFNDYEVGRRQNLEIINIFDRKAALNDQVPEAYRGLDRFEARKRVVADIEAAGLLDKVEPHRHTVPYGDRGGVPVEPYLTEQWYANMEPLAKRAVAAVEDGSIQIVPEQWTKTYYAWMNNIQPWCLSRQLWWGHRIPAWYGPDGEIFVAESEDEAKAAARAHYGEDKPLSQDEDVLDTWFSSGLWPLTTLGWPEETPELNRYYPTDVLITGFDILFFWVARMVMMGLYCRDQVPFRTVYLHALVRDEHGAKMSKSKGNIIDPLDLVDEYGADALRFTLAAMAAQGRDIKLSKGRIEGYRNFATKLWNAARFTEMNGCVPDLAFDPAGVSQPVNRWIVGETARCAAEVTEALEGFKFDQAADAVYHFAWHTYCDWYLEFAKPLLQGQAADSNMTAETRATTAWALGRILHLLHPFMPFVTEELNQQLGGGGDDHMLVTAPWPDLDADLVDAGVSEELAWVVRLISELRTVRAEVNVPPGAQLHATVYGATAETRGRFDRYAELIGRVARLSQITVADEQPGDQDLRGAAQALVDEATVVLPLGDVIDIDVERARLAKELSKLDADILKFDKKLSNEQFLAKAPEEVVAEQRSRRDDATSAREKIQAALDRLHAA